MAFQFLCPQGHLLEGEESQIGQQCQCPLCGVQFYIPNPSPAPPASPPASQAPGPAFTPAAGFSDTSPASAPGMQGPPLGEAYPAFQPEPEPLPQVGRRGALPAVGPQELPSFASTAAPQPLVHIVCPKGHVLETPREMLGEDAMCPFCQVAFRLRWEDSVEYRKAKEDEILRREQRRGKQWLQWSIAIAVVAVVGLGVLIAMTMSP